MLESCSHVSEFALLFLAYSSTVLNNADYFHVVDSKDAILKYCSTVGHLYMNHTYFLLL